MSGDIYLRAPGGRAGDIYLTIPATSALGSSAACCSDSSSTTSFSCYTINGRVVSTDGTPRDGLAITLFERRNLTVDAVVATTTTDSRGAYSIQFVLPPSTAWDVFVRAEDEEEDESVDSVLLSDLEEGSYTVDLVLGSGTYLGLSEWERVEAKVAPLLGSTLPKDVPANRLEWVCRRADVFPLHLSAYVQAHRLANGRTISPESCYAFLRAGLPSDMPSLLRAGESAYDKALRKAWDLRIISLPGDGSDGAKASAVAEAINAMRELVVEAAITSPASGTNFRVLFDTAGLSSGDQEEFMQLWLARTSVADFWSEVAASPTLGATKAAQFQFTIQATTVVGNHVPTLTALQAAPGISTVRDLAAWDYSDWDSFLVTNTITAPDEIPGANATEKRQNYAHALERVMEDAYPTLTLKHRIARDEALTSAPANTEELVAFFNTNSEFDITRTNIAHYVSGHSGAFAGTSDPVLARKNLELTQRVHRIAPRLGRYDTVKVLLDNEIESAKDALAYTRNEFINKFGGLFDDTHHSPQALAGRVWDKAAKVDGMSTLLVSQFGFGQAAIIPNALNGVAQWTLTDDGLDELQDTLATLDYCACTECRSVLSAAAYLADLLHFLDERPSEVANESALDQLEVRRPDIAAIDLDCANTNTPLPMIDLVNEVLEAYFVGPLTSGSAKQTTWLAEDLALHPEHLDATVYDGTAVGPDEQITEMVFPWILPFSLPALEAERYLGQLGISHWELMNTLVDDSPAEPTANELAAAKLGITEAQRAIIAAGVDDGRNYWGFAAGSETDNWYHVLDGTDVDDGDVGELLRRAEIDLHDLEELIDLTFIDPWHYSEVSPMYVQYSETCSVEDIEVINLVIDDDPAALGRLHRFLRLQRATGIPRRMLNVLIDDLGGTLDATFLAKLGDISWLHDELDVEWDELATWWANRIDARFYENAPAALYRRRFYSPEIAPHPDFSPSLDGGALFGEDVEPPPIVAAHIPTLLAGTGLTASDRQALADAGLAGTTFTFLNITKYFRAASFARANGLTIADLIRWISLTGIDPFTSPATARTCVETLRNMRRSGFTVRELDWLIRHPTELEAEFRDDTATAARLEQLALDLARIAEGVEALQDPYGKSIQENLGTILEAADVAIAMAILDKTTALDVTEQSTFINLQFAQFTDPTTAIAQLVTSGGAIVEVPERFAWLLMEFVRATGQQNLIVEVLAGGLGLEVRACRALLLDVLTDPGAGSDPLMSLFMDYPDEAEVDAGLTRSSHAALFAAHDRLHKASVVVNGFGIAADAIDWYSANGSRLNLDTLPLSTSDSDATFTAWNKLRAALDLRSLFPKDVQGHQQMAAAASLTDAFALLEKYTGWDVSTTTGLGSIATNLGWASASVFTDEIALGRLRDIASLVHRIGVPAATLWDWVHEELDLTITGQMKQAVRANYEETRWSKVARPLRDGIRVKQRDALVAAVLAQNTGMTRKQLADALLIDIEMSACMMTSRIKQAIGSVQTFVNRAQLELEANVALDADTAERWEWQKSYRVWEANRKVFLYPENWIEPSLRLDKTPEFIKLESTLLQNALDDEHVEAALAQYLERVDMLAKLEVVSTFQSGKELYVVSRTQSAPHQYYMRKREGGKWDPWEHIPLAIEGNNLVIVKRGFRLYLFWLTTMDANVPGATYQDTSVDFTHELVGISWAERKSSNWSEVRVSAKKLLPKVAALDVASGEIPDNIYILKTTNTSPLTELRAYVFQPGTGAWGFQQFFFDPSVKRVYPTGIGGTPQAIYHVSLGYYGPDGQRFVADGQYDKFIQPGGWTEGTVINGTTFRQGPFEVEMFQQTKQQFSRGFVHQSDEYRTSNYFVPQFFDNHDLKYLILPEPLNDKANSEGDAVEPDDIESFDWNKYAGIDDSDDEDDSEAAEDQDEQIQIAIDQLNLQEPFFLADNNPGVNQGLFQNGGIKGNNAVFMGNGGAAQAMNDAYEQIGANDGVIEDPPSLTQASTAVRLRLENFHHPYTDLIIREFNLHGVKGIYDPTDADLLRQMANEHPLDSNALDANSEFVLEPFPVNEFDFSVGGAYSDYNWEIFFHIPLLIADKLSADQRYAEAQRWYHAIFNPLHPIGPAEAGSARLWRVKPFVLQSLSQEQDQLEAMLGIDVTDDEQIAATTDFTNQVEDWLANPFDPHAVARMRPGAYMRTVFMKYLENLIAWGDQLFRRDTIESITEATILYSLAGELLGKRPTELPEQTTTPKSYNELEAAGIDAFSNAKVELENWLYLTDDDAELFGDGEPVGWQPMPMRFWYFCYPPNPKMLGYWDLVADRLWKIRNCQNIDGITRHLPLFEPPIDPGLLVQAAAAGLNFQDVLNSAAAGRPPYRFRHVYAKAIDFVGEVRNLGGMILAALEKRDGEALARIRAGHELTLLEAMREVRIQQLNDAKAQLDSIRAAQPPILLRKSYYQGLIDRGISSGEKENLDLLGEADRWTTNAYGTKMIGQVVSIIPNLMAGTGAFIDFGGLHLSNLINVFADMFQASASTSTYLASRALTNAQYKRREEEWHFQRKQAELDLERAERDVVAAEIRAVIAERELENHDRQVAQSREAEDFLRGKFSNTELYDWTIGQLATLYRQSYELAFDMATYAEAAYRHELAIDDNEPRIVQFGYWDAQQRGLLSGESLSKDLRRLEKAYMKRNVREYELRKSVSLAQLDAVALYTLQETGECTFKIPRELFDLDHPGHYLRRLRSVSLSIPAVVGPYTSLGAQLTLQEHWIQVEATTAAPVPQLGGVDMIATSNAVADAGLFQLDFNDERYLPFEYAGAISQWRLVLPKQIRQFDYRTISDVVISLAYTAREGGDGLRDDVETGLKTAFNAYFSSGATQVIAVHRAFPNEWRSFLAPEEEATEQVLTMPLTLKHFPYFAQREGLEIDGVEFVMLYANSVTSAGDVELVFSTGGDPIDLDLDQTVGPYAVDSTALSSIAPGTWTLTRGNGPNPTAVVDDGWLDPTKVLGLLMILRYKLD